MKQSLLILSLLALLVSCRSIVPTTVYYKDGTQEEGISRLTERKKNTFTVPFKSKETGRKQRLNADNVEKVEFRHSVDNYFGHIGIYRFVPIEYKIKPILVREIASGDKLSMYLNTYRRSSSYTDYSGQRYRKDVQKEKFYVMDVNKEKAFLYLPLWHGNKMKEKFTELGAECPVIRKEMKKELDYNSVDVIIRLIDLYSYYCN